MIETSNVKNDVSENMNVYETLMNSEKDSHSFDAESHTEISSANLEILSDYGSDSDHASSSKESNNDNNISNAEKHIDMNITDLKNEKNDLDVEIHLGNNFDSKNVDFIDSYSAANLNTDLDVTDRSENVSRVSRTEEKLDTSSDSDSNEISSFNDTKIYDKDYEISENGFNLLENNLITNSSTYFTVQESIKEQLNASENKEQLENKSITNFVDKIDDRNEISSYPENEKYLIINQNLHSLTSVESKSDASDDASDVEYTYEVNDANIIKIDPEHGVIKSDIQALSYNPTKDVYEFPNINDNKLNMEIDDLETYNKNSLTIESEVNVPREQNLSEINKVLMKDISHTNEISQTSIEKQENESDITSSEFSVKPIAEIGFESYDMQINGSNGENNEFSKPNFDTRTEELSRSVPDSDDIVRSDVITDIDSTHMDHFNHNDSFGSNIVTDSVYNNTVNEIGSESDMITHELSRQKINSLLDTEASSYFCEQTNITGSPVENIHDELYLENKFDVSKKDIKSSDFSGDLNLVEQRFNNGYIIDDSEIISNNIESNVMSLQSELHISEIDQLDVNTEIKSEKLDSSSFDAYLVGKIDNGTKDTYDPSSFQSQFQNELNTENRCSVTSEEQDVKEVTEDLHNLQFVENVDKKIQLDFESNDKTEFQENKFDHNSIVMNNDYHSQISTNEQSIDKPLSRNSDLGSTISDGYSAPLSKANTDSDNDSDFQSGFHGELAMSPEVPLETRVVDDNDNGFHQKLSISRVSDLYGIDDTILQDNIIIKDS